MPLTELLKQVTPQQVYAIGFVKPETHQDDER